MFMRTESYLPFSEDQASLIMNIQMLIYILVHLVQKQKVWPLRSFPNIVVKRTLDLELKNVSPTLDILLTSYGTSLNLSVLTLKWGK